MRLVESKKNPSQHPKSGAFKNTEALRGLLVDYKKGAFSSVSSLDFIYHPSTSSTQQKRIKVFPVLTITYII